VFLTAGSQVRTSIEGIGYLLNTCVAEVVDETPRAIDTASRRV
jgi:hypothetical protein